MDHKGSKAFERGFSADPMVVRDVLTALEPRLRAVGVPDSVVADLSLVLAEVLNNVVEHAHRDCRDGQVHLQVFARPCCIRCQIVDNGVAMPGLELPAGVLPQSDGDLADLPEGGFGWFLIRNMTADLTYQRKAGENHLQFNLPFEA